MTQPLTTGEKNRRANIRSLKAIGRANAKTRAATTAANIAEHLARNEDRRIQAIIDRQDRIAAHQARNARAAADAAMDRQLKALFADADCAVTIEDEALLASLGTVPVAANDSMDDLAALGDRLWPTTALAA